MTPEYYNRWAATIHDAGGREPMTQIRDYAADYDRALLDKARQLAGLNDLNSMRLWLAANGSPESEAEGHIVYGYILGRLQATTAELVRWLERIPEAHRG